MSQLNELIHQPTRLRIMAALSALGPGTEVEFTYLRDILDLTDGNLGTHLAKLEEAGYVAVRKTFVGRKPRTFVSLTPHGQHAFAEHLAALRAILNPTLVEPNGASPATTDTQTNRKGDKA